MKLFLDVAALLTAIAMVTSIVIAVIFWRRFQKQRKKEKMGWLPHRRLEFRKQRMYNWYEEKKDEPKYEDGDTEDSDHRARGTSVLGVPS